MQRRQPAPHPMRALILLLTRGGSLFAQTRSSKTSDSAFHLGAGYAAIVLVLWTLLLTLLHALIVAFNRPGRPFDTELPRSGDLLLRKSRPYRQHASRESSR